MEAAQLAMEAAAHCRGSIWWQRQPLVAVAVYSGSIWWLRRKWRRTAMRWKVPAADEASWDSAVTATTVQQRRQPWLWLATQRRQRGDYNGARRQRGDGNAATNAATEMGQRQRGDVNAATSTR